MPQALFMVFLLDSKGAKACIVHLLFATPLGLAASLRPHGFVSGAGSFVQRTLARSAFLGFQIGAPRCSSYSYLQSSVLFVPPGRHALHHRLYLLNQRRSSVPVCTPFSRLPQASLLRSDRFFSGAVCFVRRTLARSAFHGFSIRFQRCKRV